MSKISIYFSKSDKLLFISFWNKFEKTISAYHNVCIANNEDLIELNLNLPNSKKQYLISQLKFLLAESIVIYYKTKYFENNLLIPFGSDIEKNAFNKALAIFDKKSDIDYVLNILNLVDKLNIESLYNFQLSELKNRWEDVCILFRENLGYLLSTTSCLDLIKYLIDITDTEYEFVYLYYFENFFILRDNQGNELFSPVSSLTNCFSIEIIADLISLSPKNICLKFDVSQFPDLKNSINYIFDKKVLIDA